MPRFSSVLSRKHLPQDSFLGILLTVFLFAMGGLILRYHYLFMVNPYPEEYRIGTYLMDTDLILRGKDQFALSHLPVWFNVYGIFYHYVAAPFVLIFKDSLLAHRLLAEIIIMSFCAPIGLVVHRMGLGMAGVSLAVLHLYAAALYPGVPDPGPTGLAMLLFLLSVIIPWMSRFSYRGIGIGIASGLLGFYTKQYALLGIFYLVAYLFLFVSKKKGLWAFLVFVTGFCLSVFLVSRLYPFYFYTTTLAMRHSFSYTFGHMVNQWLAFFFKQNPVLTVLVLWLFWRERAGIMRRLRSLRDRGIWHGLREWKTWDRPLFPEDGNLFLFCLLASAVIITLVMGRHTGQTLGYHFHIFYPFFLIYGFEAAKRLLRPLLAISFLSVNLVFCYTFNAPQTYLPQDLEAWQKAVRLIEHHHNILHSPALAPVLFKESKPVYDAGKTCDMELATYTRTWVERRLFPRTGELKARWDDYRMEIQQKIERKEFDLIMLEDWSWMHVRDIILQYYDYQGGLVLRMPYSQQTWWLEVWKPKQ